MIKIKIERTIAEIKEPEILSIEKQLEPSSEELTEKEKIELIAGELE